MERARATTGPFTALALNACSLASAGRHAAERCPAACPRSNSGFTTALYGVLYTLAKEKFSDSWKFAVGTVVVEFFLIVAIFINLEYPWDTDPHSP